MEVPRFVLTFCIRILYKAIKEHLTSQGLLYPLTQRFGLVSEVPNIEYKLNSTKTKERTNAFNY